MILVISKSDKQQLQVILGIHNDDLAGFADEDLIIELLMLSP